MPKYDQRISYGDLPDQFCDLYLPEGFSEAHSLPTILLIHGGCWLAEFPLDGIAAAARRLSAEGWIVWSIEYRRLGNGGGWPTTFTDVAAAADHLRILAEAVPIDLENVIVVGHSAGGHLAAWLAGRKNLPAGSELWTSRPLELRGMISLAGITDLERAMAEDLCGDAPERLIGADDQRHEVQLTQASPSCLYPFGLPQIHIVGDSDPYVQASYVAAVVEQASVQGEDVELVLVSPVGHFEVVVPDSPIFAQVIAEIQKLV